MSVWNWYTQAFPPKPTFTEIDLPRQNGRVSIVAGGNKGVGYHLCQMLYPTGATIYMACRSQEKAERAIETIIAAATPPPTNPGTLKFLHLDFTDFHVVVKAAETFARQETRLDVLWNQAGIGAGAIPKGGAKTAQGVEISIATHCVGPLLFSQRLLPQLREAAASSPTGATRVVWTSSWLAEGGTPKGGIEMDKLQGTGDNVRDYSVSKVGNWVLSLEWATRYPNDGILSVVQNPGNLRTDMYAGLNWLVSRLLNLTLLYDPKLGAHTELFAGFSPELTLDGHQGQYIMPWGRIQAKTPRQDIIQAVKPAEEGGQDLGKRFWDWCEEQWKGVL